MNDVVISAKDLRKVYRLYTRPSYRFRDMFGLLGDKPGAYAEHAALDGVNLEIRRGEKVAIIGRNGAGKSTLLKLVTGVIQPTRGQIDVNAAVHALLQIGTGFHPDFTGRENVLAYLAQLGVTGADARRRCAEAVEFAELEEYIDQPVKTYSTGMGVRLMFAASTVISPELLVLDEVLGVGDAYFAQKSFDRMQELSVRSGTTLLLVTHDVYSAVRLCERVIWIDRGRVLHDADGPTVVALYEDSIRLQEERRLRLKASQRLQELNTAGQLAAQTRINVEVHARSNTPQPSPVYFSRIELLVDGVSKGRLPLNGEPESNESAWLQMDGTSWGEPTVFEGRPGRAFRNFGSPFHKVGGVVAVDGDAHALSQAQLTVEADFWSEQPCELDVHCFVDGHDVVLGALPPSRGLWTTGVARRSAPDPAGALARSNRQGTGVIVVDRVRLLNQHGAETFAFAHGEPLSLEFRYRINQRGLRERAQVLVAFHRDGVQDVMRSITRNLFFDEPSGRDGTVLMTLPKLPLANGSYTVTLMIAKEGYYDQKQAVYFSLNPGVYTCLPRMFEIVVEGGGIVADGTATLVDADWSLIPSSVLRPAGNLYHIDVSAVARDFPQEFDYARSATERVLAEIKDADLSKLAEHSPGLRGYDWTAYLHCSMVRLTRVLRALRTHVGQSGRVLDVGAYFGNASLMCSSAGYSVDALDAYGDYAPAFDGCTRALRESGVRVLDFAECGTGLEKLTSGAYDAALCLGVIEHLPHTPRPFLESLDRLLKPGGVLIVDTPNIAYLYSRMKLARGESIMPLIGVQFGVTPPFEGHHREYTPDEVEWMLRALKHQVLETETFNYSQFGLTELTRDQAVNVMRMDADASLREIILSVSRKPF